MKADDKKALVAKYKPQATADNQDNVRQAIVDGEPGIKAEDVDALLAALYPPPPTAKKAVVGYEEWRMEWVPNPKYKKGNGEEPQVLQQLKKLRDLVKITADEAQTLNDGAGSPGSVNPIQYFPVTG